ncbi:MAG: iron chelate uptake ABC transporter family permease subunit [Blastocatellia bacterium]|nr:iron chelate uptake ABC transporter family permease subunit [Blastocatellia bacterium]
MSHHKWNNWWFFGCAGIGLALVVVIGISVGSTQVTPGTVLRVLAFHLSGGWWGTLDGISQPDHTIVWLLRTPRVLTALLVGASLAVAGAQMQGLFQNPLASPDIIGTSSGGALGAVTAIALGLASKSIFFLPVLAFAGASMCAFTVYALATERGKTPIATLILTGLAVNSLMGAATSFVITLHSVRWEVSSEIILWMMGGLESRTWDHVAILTPCFLIGLGLAVFFAKDLNLLLLNEETAASLGVEVQTVKQILLAGAALLTGGAVAVSGLVGFVGLIIPHVVRLLVGPDHRVLIPACALTGAVFLIVTDLFARTVTAPTEIRLGILTAALGAPFFLFLLVKQRREIGYL